MQCALHKKSRRSHWSFDKVRVRGAWDVRCALHEKKTRLRLKGEILKSLPYFYTKHTTKRKKMKPKNGPTQNWKSPGGLRPEFCRLNYKNMLKMCSYYFLPAYQKGNGRRSIGLVPAPSWLLEDSTFP